MPMNTYSYLKVGLYDILVKEEVNYSGKILAWSDREND
jgi:hypothetical protein